MTEKTDSAETKIENIPQGKQDDNGKNQTAPIPKELVGTKGLEPTRYGDWEHKGIISDF